ncbi:MAG: DNA-binding protein [Anaerolinea sp.]|nr:DNA-binding protein [Anaerolinea sp.]
MRVAIEPALLRWASERSGRETEDLRAKFPKLGLWEQGEAQPTLKQLEQFAKATHTPVGYFFLPEPPVDEVPIPDLRTVGNRHLGRPSPDLLETVYICQQRQEWYRDYARSTGEPPHDFVGSARVEDEIVATAGRIRHALGFDLEERRQLPTWTDALRRFIEQADALGILVMVSGIVGNNTHRSLNPEEFRGFALSDAVAPLIFVNGADSKAAQMFTVAHELAHVWLGQSGVSDAQAAQIPEQRIERWCNQVAAELLVPLEVVRREYYQAAALRSEMDRLARRFKVSTLVVLRRIFDAGFLTWDAFRHAYAEERDRLLAIPRSSGGNFYLTQGTRLGKRFAGALVVSTLEGQTLHRDAFRLLGFSRLETFRELGRNLGVS